MSVNSYFTDFSAACKWLKQQPFSGDMQDLKKSKNSSKQFLSAVKYVMLSTLKASKRLGLA